MIFFNQSAAQIDGQSRAQTPHAAATIRRYARSLLVALLLALGLAFVAAPVQAAIRYVDPDGANALGCLTPANACHTLTQAITAAAANDEIRIAKGTYTGPQITVNKLLTIRGGYDPDVTGGWDTSTYTTTPTILDGQNTDRVLYIAASSTVVEFLTITKGNATNANPSADFGGGILVSGASNVVLRGLVVTNNVASTDNASSMGGGVALVGLSSLTIDRSLILSNSAQASGGGVGVTVTAPNQAVLNVDSTVIARNSSGEGGALGTSGSGRSVVDFYHSTLADNNIGTPGADEAVFMTAGSASPNSLNFSYTLITGNNTLLRGNTAATISMLSTGVIIDPSVTNDWEGTVPVLNPAVQRALPFVNPAASDYHLVAGSPAIDIAGNTLRIDLEGRQRVNSPNCTPFTLCPLGRSDDYGAYEYVNIAPSIRYVAPGGTDSINNCLNPALPCSTPENANKIVLGGDEIRLAQATYSGGDATCANAAVLCIRQGIILTGGFVPPDWTTPSTNPLLTVLDGTGIRHGIRVDYDVPTASSTIQNLAIRNGYSLVSGAGIAIGTQNLGPAQNLTIRNCWVENSRVDGDGVGGGIFANDPVNLTVENCTLTGNSIKDGRGGGLGITDANGDATYNLSKLTVYNNFADRPDENSANGGRGGGIFLEGIGTLSQSEVYSNAATFNGGGVSVGSNDANPKIDRVIIRDNRAGVGGGFSIFLTGGATLQNSLLIRNVATSTVPMVGQNVEIFGGNAIHTPEGGSPAKPLHVINVTIADNDGAVPEAVKVEGLADLSTTRPNNFTNVLISGNEVGIKSDGLGVASLTNVLITNDVTTKLDGFAVDRLTGTALDGVAGFVGGGDYHLVPGADGVDDGVTVAAITQDLDGVSRPLGPAYDIGAYETTLQKLNQVITFDPISNRPLAGSPFSVNPTADSGLPVQLTSLTAAVCTVSGFQVTLVAVGTCTLEANQPGNAAYNPAPAVQRSFEITVEEPKVKLHMPLLERQ